MADVELTILMPCLNEARTLPDCLRQAFDFLRRAGVAGEVLVSDNGSSDAPATSLWRPELAWWMRRPKDTVRH